jgi:hypothetical protein
VGIFAKTPNPLIFLDSTVRQSTGFDRSASSNGIKSQFLGIFGANCHAGAKLQPRRKCKNQNSSAKICH